MSADCCHSRYGPSKLTGLRLAILSAYTSIYLSTLPHTSVDAAIWVWSWVGTTTCLSIVSSQILETKVRSKGLLFLFKYFSHLV